MAGAEEKKESGGAAAAAGGKESKGGGEQDTATGSATPATKGIEEVRSCPTSHPPSASGIGLIQDALDTCALGRMKQSNQSAALDETQLLERAM